MEPGKKKTIGNNYGLGIDIERMGRDIGKGKA